MATIDQQQVNESYLMKAGEILGPIKALSYEALELKSVGNLLDVGCGPGIDAINMAKITRDDCHITGVDFDERMITAATSTAEKLGLLAKLNFQQANAYELPFTDDSFCATRSERLLMHLDKPDLALAEMARVTKPGGTLVVIDTDWATLSCATGNDTIERKINHHQVHEMLPNGYSGRNLPGQFHELGLNNVAFSVHAFYVNDPMVWRLMVQMDQVEQSAIASGVVTQQEVQEWHNGIQQHFNAGKFHASLNLTLAKGKIPDA